MTTEPNPQDQDEVMPEDKLSRLVGLASALVEELDDISHDAGNQFVSLAKQAGKNRRMITVLVISLVLDVALSIILALITAQVVNLTDRLDVAQTTQRQKALCPLYQVFLDNKSAAGRNAAPDPVKYDHAFAVIQDGYDVLGCAAFITKGP